MIVMLFIQADDAESRYSLFFHGCLGEQLPDMADAIFAEGIDVGICLMVFIFLGPFTVPWFRAGDLQNRLKTP